MTIPTLVAVVVFETQDRTATLWNLVAVRMANLNRQKSYRLEENIKIEKKKIYA